MTKKQIAYLAPECESLELRLEGGILTDSTTRGAGFSSEKATEEDLSDESWW